MSKCTKKISSESVIINENGRAEERDNTENGRQFGVVSSTGVNNPVYISHTPASPTCMSSTSSSFASGSDHSTGNAMYVRYNC